MVRWMFVSAQTAVRVSQTIARLEQTRLRSQVWPNLPTSQSLAESHFTVQK